MSVGRLINGHQSHTQYVSGQREGKPPKERAQKNNNASIGSWDASTQGKFVDSRLDEKLEGLVSSHRSNRINNLNSTKNEQDNMVKNRSKDMSRSIAKDGKDKMTGVPKESDNDQYNI
jgi:hypothetical protein